MSWSSAGRGIKPVFVDGRELGRDALATQQSLVRAPDAIADLEPRAARAELLDGAGQVAADHVGEGQRHRDEPRSEVEVDRVQRDRVHLDEHLPGPGSGRATRRP